VDLQDGREDASAGQPTPEEVDRDIDGIPANLAGVWRVASGQRGPGDVAEVVPPVVPGPVDGHHLLARSASAESVDVQAEHVTDAH
jgi:hypothetical protein